VGLTGQTFAHYKIIEKLGEGGMGVVYKARDEKLDRTVALKFLPAYLKDDADLRRRLVQEARAASALDHPNIVVIYDIDVAPDGAVFVAMAFHEGETLQQRIRTGLSIREAVEIARQVASGLAKAHDRGIFHRDIKPSNVIVSADGVARIIDFGLAKPQDATATIDGTIRGTPVYMSPEQATGGVVDCRTDLWSLGAVLYEMLTGKRPFDGKSTVDLLRAIANRTPARVRELRPEVPEALEAIVSRALEKNPADRYQSAGDMAGDLAAVQASSSAALPAPAQKASSRRAIWLTAGAAIITLAAAGWSYVRSERRHWAREEAIPEITRLMEHDQPLAALLVLRQARVYLAGDQALSGATTSLTRSSSIRSEPAGATVEIQDYVTPDGPWLTLGTTPLENVEVPQGYFRWRVTKGKDATYEAAMTMPPVFDVSLTAISQAPVGMMPVPAASWTGVIGFLGWIGPYPLPAFDIDRYEVTNRQFQEFVDQGGYTRQEFWKERFVRDGHVLSWAEGMAQMRDSSGRPGPSSWRAGHYPEGQADFPVSGVSWYEAAAYAAFARKDLPAIAQWYEAAPSNVARYITRLSNVESPGPAAVGTSKGVGPFGTYDMSGNVREWCLNAQTGADRRFILGGSWTAPSYMYYVPETLPPFDRSAGNGFRLVQNHGAVPAEALAARGLFARDAAHLVPASDEVFRVYRSLYAYEPTPLKATLEGSEDTADWRKEKVSFTAAYGQERVPAYVFLPKHVRPPFQAVVFFPSARVLGLPSSDALGDMRFIDFVIQSGRAVIYPIYRATYERVTGEDRRLGSELPAASHGRDVLIDRTKDVSRAIDYLTSRPDIDASRIGFLGVSMGAAQGAIVTAIEQRFKVIVWLDGGLFLDPPMAGMDQVDFAPRVIKPLLMINGRYDFVFSPQAAQEPLFRLVGTPAADKRHVMLETSHDVTTARAELVKEVVAWLDKYLGKIQ
jgi:tRNA A-37 threonylcarbamoyl transferase component Bud32/dienelactone hydrolase